MYGQYGSNWYYFIISFEIVFCLEIRWLWQYHLVDEDLSLN